MSAPPHRRYRPRWTALTFICIGWLICIAAILMRGGAVEWFLGALLGGIVLTSSLAPLIAVKGLRVERSLSSTELEGGGHVEVKLSFDRRFAFPFVWLCVREEWTNLASIYEPAILHERVILSPFARSWPFSYRLEGLRRGRCETEGVIVTVGDWLGLVAYSRKLSCPSTFLVLPELPKSHANVGADAAVRGTSNVKGNLTVAGRGSIMYTGGPVSSAMEGGGLDSRPYRPGDSIRHVDWRGAAKGRGLYTRLADAVEHAYAIIVVDTAASVTNREEEQQFEACIGHAALMACEAVQNGNMVKLLTTADSQENGNEIGRGDASASADIGVLLRCLASFHAKAPEAQAKARSRVGTRANKELLQGLGQREGVLSIFTTDWRNSARWESLAEQGKRMGIRLRLHVAIGSQMPSYAMREQQKRLDAAGIRIRWLQGEKKSAKDSVMVADGGHTDDRVQI